MEFIRVSSAVYKLKGNEAFVDVVGASTVYLKERGTQAVTIRKSDSGAGVVTVSASGSDSIERNVSLAHQHDYATFAPIQGGYVVVDHYTASKFNPVAATGVLSISDVVKDGETVTIGTDVYEFCADAAQTLTEGSTIAVDISAYTTASTGTLTVSTNPTAGQTLVIGPSGDATTYTFVAAANFDEEGEIPLGATAAATQANIIAALMGTDGINAPDPYVTIGAFTDNAATITALVGGTVGDSITTTDNITGGFGAGTLGSGADCSAANAATALIATINAKATNGVTAATGGSGIVALTATAGLAGNSLATTQTMTNGAFAYDTLVGGSDFGATSPVFSNATNEVTINTHSYASDTTDWTLSAAELLKHYHKVTLAGGAVNAIIPLTPSIPYTFINASGHALTVKGASGTGTEIEIANEKTATVMSDGTNVIRLTVDA